MNKAVLKEDRIHGNPLYPVSVYEWSGEAGRTLLDLHWHDELELLMVTKGRAVFRVNMADYELKAGEAIFINTGELHAGHFTDGLECSFRAVVFHSDIVGGSRFDLVQEKYIQPLLHKKRTVPVRVTPDTEAEREIVAMLEQVFELNFAKAPLYELTTKGLLQLIVSKLLLLGGPDAREPQPPADRLKIERVKTIIDYIQTNSSKPLRLQDLAALVSISEAYLCRFFKEFTRKSPLEYINQVRVQKAAGLLKNTNHKIMEIALDVGFNNLSYFVVVFKHYFGCTPSEYRKRDVPDTERL